ncbi:MAG: ompA [Myxococcaceae bacterium]|nr:ompA [Myxococcaceae bacterium]
MTRVSPLLAALLLAAPVLAEQSKLNLTIEPAAGAGLNRSTLVTGGWLKLDTTIFGLGPIAPSIEVFGIGSQNVTYLASGAAYGAGIGLRLRLLNDEHGYFFNPGTEANGNLWGNLWLDAHFIGAHGGLGVGFDVNIGYEFSLIDGLQLGPFGKFVWIGSNQMLLAGLSFTVGFPNEPPADYDPDNDGIKGAADKCPNDPEDMDGFEDEDGCPELDNDKDAVPDTTDKCPMVAEDKDNFEDTDGCPDPDNDKDGVLDAADKCPIEAEDKDGFEDADGCPELDNDKDKIVDAKDSCPLEPEDLDGFEDEDGCPETDNDKDGIVDGKDKCPLEPETFNGVDDEDGCPEKETKVYVTREKIVITEKIFFEFNKAKILPASDPLLDNVAQVLNKFPQVKKIRIEGHTDDIGTDAQNQTLSEKRAKAVYDAMVKRKVDATRLESKGYGKSQPLVKENTDAAREKNRRVEFIVVDMVPIVEEVIKPVP